MWQTRMKAVALTEVQNHVTAMNTTVAEMTRPR